jgi:hypothetical protein
MQVFLSYAREDEASAKRLRRALAKLRVDTWFDQHSLVGGENWTLAVSEAIRESDYFIALLSSRSVRKRGYFQREIREAIEVLDQCSPDDSYLIPVRLDDCKPTHERLNGVTWVDLFPQWRPGLSKLRRRLAPEQITLKKSSNRDSPRVRTDGVYVARTAGPYPYHYLKFFRDHSVVGCSSHWDATEIAPWLSTTNMDIAHGRYSVRREKGRTRVAFQLDLEGVVDYRGYVVAADVLVFRKQSYINGHRDVEEYQFESPN